jgi:hypothetical protein
MTQQPDPRPDPEAQDIPSAGTEAEAETGAGTGTGAEVVAGRPQSAGLDPATSPQTVRASELSQAEGEDDV